MMIPGGSHEGNKPVVGVDLQQSREYFAQMLPHSKGQEGDGCSNLDPVRAGFGAAATTALITTSVFAASSRAATTATAGELVRAAWSPLPISAPMIPGYNTEQEIPSIHVPLAGVDAGFSQPPVAEIILSGEIDQAKRPFPAVSRGPEALSAKPSAPMHVPSSATVQAIDLAPFAPQGISGASALKQPVMQPVIATPAPTPLLPLETPAAPLVLSDLMPREPTNTAAVAPLPNMENTIIIPGLLPQPAPVQDSGVREWSAETAPQPSTLGSAAFTLESPVTIPQLPQPIFAEQSTLQITPTLPNNQPSVGQLASPMVPSITPVYAQQAPLLGSFLETPAAEQIVPGQGTAGTSIGQIEVPITGYQEQRPAAGLPPVAEPDEAISLFGFDLPTGLSNVLGPAASFFGSEETLVPGSGSIVGSGGMVTTPFGTVVPDKNAQNSPNAAEGDSLQKPPSKESIKAFRSAYSEAAKKRAQKYLDMKLVEEGRDGGKPYELFMKDMLKGPWCAGAATTVDVDIGYPFYTKREGVWDNGKATSVYWNIEAIRNETNSRVFKGEDFRARKLDDIIMPMDYIAFAYPDGKPGAHVARFWGFTKDGYTTVDGNWGEPVDKYQVVRHRWGDTWTNRIYAVGMRFIDGPPAPENTRAGLKNSTLPKTANPDKPPKNTPQPIPKPSDEPIGVVPGLVPLQEVSVPIVTGEVPPTIPEVVPPANIDVPVAPATDSNEPIKGEGPAIIVEAPAPASGQETIQFAPATPEFNVPIVTQIAPEISTDVTGQVVGQGNNGEADGAAE